MSEPAHWERVTRLPEFPRLVLHELPMPEQVDQYETGTNRIRRRWYASRQPTMPRPHVDHWTDDALCTADPELFDPAGPGELPFRMLDAIALCNCCPVIDECRREQHRNPTVGVRAGDIYTISPGGKVRWDGRPRPWRRQYRPRPVWSDYEPPPPRIGPPPPAYHPPPLPPVLMPGPPPPSPADSFANAIGYALDLPDLGQVHWLLTRVDEAGVLDDVLAALGDDADRALAAYVTADDQQRAV